MPLHVAELWRYPVKSLAGERVSMATLLPDGLSGDRIVRVRGPEGVRTSRRHYRLLGLRGTLDAHGHARIDGHPWDSADALARVRDAAGADAWLEKWGDSTDSMSFRCSLRPTAQLPLSDVTCAAFAPTSSSAVSTG